MLRFAVRRYAVGRFTVVIVKQLTTGSLSCRLTDCNSNRITEALASYHFTSQFSPLTYHSSPATHHQFLISQLLILYALCSTTLKSFLKNIAVFFSYIVKFKTEPFIIRSLYEKLFSVVCFCIYC